MGSVMVGIDGAIRIGLDHFPWGTNNPSLYSSPFSHKTLHQNHFPKPSRMYYPQVHARAREYRGIGLCQFFFFRWRC